MKRMLTLLMVALMVTAMVALSAMPAGALGFGGGFTFDPFGDSETEIETPFGGAGCTVNPLQFQSGCDFDFGL